MQSIFENDIKERKIILDKYNKKSNILGIFKLIVVAFICYGAYNTYKNRFPIDLILLLLIEAIIFLIAHFFHMKIFAKIHMEEGQITIDEKNLKRINGEWRNFEDIGEEFINNNHPYAVDLDIIGKKSIFQMLNSTNTLYGRNQFANDLLNPKFTQDEIVKRQNAITELSNKYNWSCHIEYLFSKVGIDKNFEKLINSLKSNEHFIKEKYLIFILKYLWIPTFTSIILSILFRNRIAFYSATALLAIQTIISLVGFTKALSYVGIMQQLPRRLFKYETITNEIMKENFESVKLNEIKSIITSAKQGLNELYSIADRVSRFQYGVAHFLANILFLRDYKNAIKLDIWKQKYSVSVESWFITLGELESLLSFANLPRVCKNVSIPVSINSKSFIKAYNLGHPLINNDKRVCNDFELNNCIYIISGSNMSGKTTFMRTVGINMILAKAGSYVCAKEMSFSNMNVITSMRIVDDLNEGISTFYAELKRIKMLVDTVHNDNNTLFLIDEIFRGTNSVDRLKGAEGVLKELSNINAIGMITTHDLEVCKLETTHNGIKNLSFCENYIDDEIYFDYKLKQGKSQTTNAEYLLKKVGILK